MLLLPVSGKYQYISVPVQANGYETYDATPLLDDLGLLTQRSAATSNGRGEKEPLLSGWLGQWLQKVEKLQWRAIVADTLDFLLVSAVVAGAAYILNGYIVGLRFVVLFLGIITVLLIVASRVPRRRVLIGLSLYASATIVSVSYSVYIASVSALVLSVVWTLIASAVVAVLLWTAHRARNL
jgi:hypothetical protein